MVDLMGCQASSVGKNEFAYDKERLDVSLQLNFMKIAMQWAYAMSW